MDRSFEPVAEPSIAGTTVLDAGSELRHPRDVVFEYHRRIDSGQALSGLDLFEDDAVFQAKGHEMHGRSQIREFLSEREAQQDRHTLHLCANTQTRIAGETATVVAHILLYVRRDDGSYQLDRVLDTEHVLRRSDHRWRIAVRRSGALHGQH